MRTVTIRIPDKRYSSFIELIKKSGFAEFMQADNTAAKNEILEIVYTAVEEMKLIKAGKLQGRNAEDLFDEL